MIEKNQTYIIKGNSKYFKEKYGTTNPKIKIEDIDKVVFGGSWMVQNGNPACVLFGMRSGFENIPDEGNVYYGHIGAYGELVHESELRVE